MKRPLPIRRRLSPSRLRQALAAAFLLVLLCCLAPAQGLSPLAPRPDWSTLEPYQETITQEEFTRLLNEVYAPGGASAEVITVTPESAVVRTSLRPPQSWTLRFAAAGVPAKPQPITWRDAVQLGTAPADKPLGGMKIAIDPGHLGGEWAKMEQRYFQVGESRPVVEGDMTLRVAQLLQGHLTHLGAEVSLVRQEAQPTTTERPATLGLQARAELFSGQPTPPTLSSQAVQDESELLFYRTSEIRHRAVLVNERLKPDLTLCLHFNAEAWGDPKKPAFVPRNHLHILLNGAYSAAELRKDDVRYDMLVKLLGGCYSTELGAGASVAAAMAKATGLPPYQYTTTNATSVPGNEYLWVRNLLANRLYRSPVIFLEPYVMNSEEVWERVQAGDYEGEILLAGRARRSIFREYAEAVAEGVRDYYLQARPAAK